MRATFVTERHESERGTVWLTNPGGASGSVYGHPDETGPMLGVWSWERGQPVRVFWFADDPAAEVS